MRSIEDAISEIDQIVASHQSYLDEANEYANGDERKMTKEAIARRAAIDALRDLKEWIIGN